MNKFESELQRRLEAVRAASLFRSLRRIDSAQGPVVEAGDRPFRNFSSNDYLGFANEPALREAACEAIARYGVGAGSSRLICGSLAPHHELEEVIADFKQQPAALAFSSGFAAALGAITALLSKADVIILDKLAHACMIDAARLSGATLRVFAHNDLDDLELRLKWARERSRENAILIVTESVFSMDGDVAPLKELADLKDKYNAWLIVDEAHATGLYGDHLRGCAEAAGVSHRVEIQMGTLGKAIGSAGGFICGSRSLIDLLINRARSFIFSTAPVPASCAAATAGFRLLQGPVGHARRTALFERIAQISAGLPALTQPTPSPILPLIIGGENDAMTAAAALREQGYLIPAVRFPTVPRRQARLRLTLGANHTTAEVEELLQTLRRLGITGLAQPSAEGIS